MATRKGLSIPAVECLESRKYFSFDNFGGFMGGLPGNNSGFLGGFSTGGGTASEILGSDITNLSNPTPNNLLQFVQQITGYNDPYNLRDPFSHFYQDNPSSNGFGLNPFPNYDLWLLMNGYGPQYDSTLASIMGLQAAPAPIQVIDSGFVDPGSYGAQYEIDPSAQPDANGMSDWSNVITKLTSNVNSNTFNPDPIGGNNQLTGGDIVTSQHSRSDLKAMTKIQKMLDKYGADLGDLSRFSSDQLKSLYKALKAEPKRLAMIRKVESYAARHDLQVDENTIQSMSLADLKSYFKQLKSGG